MAISADRDLTVGLPPAATRFLRYLEQNEKSRLTIYDYSRTYKRFFDKHAEVTLDTIEDFLSLTKGKTRSKYRLQLKGLAEYNDIAVNWKKIAAPNPGKEAPLVLSHEQEREIRKYIERRNPRYARIFTFFTHTALRSGEVACLLPEDLRFIKIDGMPKPYIVVRKQEGSSHSDNGRNVPLDHIAYHVISDLGLPLRYNRNILNELIIEARRFLRYPDFTIHSLRKTALSRMREQGADILGLMHIAGHKNSKTLLEYIDRGPEAVYRSVFGKRKKTDEVAGIMPDFGG